MIQVKNDVHSTKELDVANELMEKSNKNIQNAMKKAKQVKEQNEKKRIVEETIKGAIGTLECVLPEITVFRNKEMENMVNNLIDKIKDNAIKISQEKKEETMMNKLQEIQEEINDVKEKVKKKTELYKLAEAKTDGMLNDLVSNFNKTGKNFRKSIKVYKNNPRTARVTASTVKKSGGGSLKTPTVEEFLDIVGKRNRDKAGFNGRLISSLSNNDFNWNAVIREMGGAQDFFAGSRKFLQDNQIMGGTSATNYYNALSSLGIAPETTYSKLMKKSYDAADGNRILAAAYMALTHNNFLAPQLRTLGTRDDQLRGPLTGFNCATGSMYFHIAAMNGGDYRSTQDFITEQSSAGNYNGSVGWAYQVTVTEGHGQRMSCEDIQAGDFCFQYDHKGTDHHMCLVLYTTPTRIYTFDTNAAKKVGWIDAQNVVTEVINEFDERLPQVGYKNPWVVASPEGLYQHFGR